MIFARRTTRMRSSLFCIACLLLASGAFAEESFFQHSVRSPRQQEVIYFLMPDRFANGNAENDAGGISGGVGESGFDPAGMYSFHGGDLAGIQAKLDYLHHLGITSIWTTPIFRNRAVQSLEEGKPVRTGYQGYRIHDYTAPKRSWKNLLPKQTNAESKLSSISSSIIPRTSSNLKMAPPVTNTSFRSHTSMPMGILSTTATTSIVPISQS